MTEEENAQEEGSVEEDESVEKDEVVEENENLNEISFISTTTDSSFILPSDQESDIREEKYSSKMYYLSMQEIHPEEDTPSVMVMDSKTSFEERTMLSSILVKDLAAINQIPPQFSSDFEAVLNSFRKCVKYNDANLDMSQFKEYNEKEQALACMLFLFVKSIRKEQNATRSSTVIKIDKNLEMNFIIKYVSLLFETVINASSLQITWDTTPNCYKNCTLGIQHCRHDAILRTQDDLEVGTIEIKPYNTSDELVEIDKSRLAESLKKQLNQRLYVARDQKELFTYGILINGRTVLLSTMHLSEKGEYEYQVVYDTILGTSSKDYGYMGEILEILVYFVELAEDSLIDRKEIEEKDFIFSKYSNFVKPTVYLLKDEHN